MRVLKLPALKNLIQDITEKGGREFEKAVCDAFNFLDFKSSLTETTEAESDVIAEAHYAEIPYFIVIECQASREGNQVGVDKLGQIRGNSPGYLDTRRQRLFEKGYKLIVGKPEFSNHARNRAKPDVGLITADVLINLLKAHNRYRFSQNELQEIFGKVGETDETHLALLITNFLSDRQYGRRLRLYSLIYIALLRNPYSDKLERRKGWTSIDQIVGEVIAYGKLFRMRDLTGDEIIHLVRDLDNPFLKIVELGRTKARLSSVSKSVIENSSYFGKDLVAEINENLEKLRSLQV